MVRKLGVIAMVAVALTLAACTSSTSSPTTTTTLTTARSPSTSTTETTVPAKATAQKRHCSDGDVVDASSNVHFAPLRVLLHRHRVVQQRSRERRRSVRRDDSPRTASTSSFRLVKISLSSYHVLRSSVFHGNYSAPIIAFGAVWVANSGTR